MSGFLASIYRKIAEFFGRSVEEQKDVVIGDPEVYKKLTKNQLVGLLWERDIEHNKRMVKQELIDLLVEDDKKRLG